MRFKRCMDIQVISDKASWWGFCECLHRTQFHQMVYHQFIIGNSIGKPWKYPWSPPAGPSGGQAPAKRQSHRCVYNLVCLSMACRYTTYVLQIYYICTICLLRIYIYTTLYIYIYIYMIIYMIISIYMVISIYIYIW